MLNMLEGFNVGEGGHNSSRSLHLLVEVMRRAFADRAKFMGDADFVKVPVTSMISKAYAAELRSILVARGFRLASDRHLGTVQAKLAELSRHSLAVHSSTLP